MAKSALQIKLEKRAETEGAWGARLSQGKLEALAKEAENAVSMGKIVTKVRALGLVDPIREMDTFSRSLKTSDTGKIAIVVAQHLYGKYKVPAYLSNAWNFIFVDKSQQANNAVANWRRNRDRETGAQDNISTREIENYCAWYSVAASGGSLWKEFTKSYSRRKTWTDEKGIYHSEFEDVPLFTKKENHSFLTCPLRGANVREAIIYTIAIHYTSDIGNITRLCKSKLATRGIDTDNPIEFYTRRIWREVIHFFCENVVPISEMNDLLDYIQHAIQQNGEFSLKGRTLLTLRRHNRDWHWELNRVKRMGDSKWEGVPIPNEIFSLPGSQSIEWTMEQITTSKMLANEGTSMHHCVYSYQSRCVKGTCAIWSLKKRVTKKGHHDGIDRALTIEMDTTNGSLVQIRGIVNRTPTNEEMSAVRTWAQKHNFRVSRY